MTDDASPYTMRSDSITPVTSEVAEIVRRGMVAWSERIARTALDRLSIPDRRSRAADAVQMSNLGDNDLKVESNQS